MNMFFKEVAEITVKRFAESPLGKMAENKSFDKPMSEYDKPLGITKENAKNCPLEGNGGRWDGVRGESKWISDRDYVNTDLRSNPEGLTNGQIMDKYGIDGIPYKNGEPDFTTVREKNGFGKPVEIDGFSDNRAKNFAKADEAYAKENGMQPEGVKEMREGHRKLTWHERSDCKTMELVPSEVHNNKSMASHSGGISKMKESNDV